MKALAGAPAIHRVMQRLDRVRRADVRILATSTDPSDDALADAGARPGWTVVRGPLDDVLARFDGAAPADVDAVVRITADCPMVDPELVDRHIQVFLNEQPWAEYVSNAVVRTQPKGLDVEVVSRAMLSRAHREAVRDYDREHVLPWVQRRGRIVPVAQDVDLSSLRWTVDTPADYAAAAAIFDALGGAAFSSRDVYALLLEQPGLIHIRPDGTTTADERAEMARRIEAHLKADNRKLSNKSGAGRPVAGVTAAGRPVAGVTAAGRPVAGVTGAGRPAAGLTGAGRPVAGVTGAGRPVGPSAVGGTLAGESSMASSDANGANRASAALPFLPYGRQCVEADDVEAVAQVLTSDYLTTGPAVAAFEEAVAAAVGAKYAVAVSSGTAALHAACFAAGVGQGDRIVVPSAGFLATANCGRYLGAEPVFADCDPDTGLILPSEVERLCREEPVKAVFPTDLTGAPADVEAVAAAAGDAVIIEDAAHALGGTRNGRPIGGCDPEPRMAIFSFHPVKHVTTGEGGAVTFNDPALLEPLRQFRSHGMVRDPERLQYPSPGPWYYEQQLLGHNLRLTDIQAALGVSQLKKLSRFVTRRRALALAYDAQLAEVPWVQPVAESMRRDSALHLYAVLIDFDGLGISRKDLMIALRTKGIGTQVHYIPIPMQPYYRERGWTIDAFPGALRYYQRTLSLPLFPSMADGDVDRVVDGLKTAVRECGS